MSDNKQSGMTILELTITLVVVAMVMLFASLAMLEALKISQLRGATRKVLAEIRHTRSLALSDVGTFGLHWGGDTGAPGKDYFRVEENTGTACSWPPVGDVVTSNANVITDWFDLSDEYTGITIASIEDNNNQILGGIAFNSRGGSDNPCTVVAYPVTITISSPSGATRTIEIQGAGVARMS